MSEIIKNIPEIYNIPATAHESFLPVSMPLGKSLRQQGITLAGISQVIPPYFISRPDPVFHLVIYTISGSANLSLPDGGYILRPGDIFTAPAHSSYSYHPSDDWQFGWFHLSDMPRWRSINNGGVVIRPARDFMKIIRAMEGLIEESLRGEPDGNAATRSYADLILFYLQRELAVQQDVAANRLHSVWAQVNRHLSYQWTVQELASLVPCSAPQLFRDTAAHHASTPMDMVARLRIARVKELLRNSEYTLEHIAALVGYATPFALSRRFKQYTGISPREYRQSGGIG